MGTETSFSKYLKPSEQQTAARVVDDLLAAGYSLGVFDGEEITVKRSTDRQAILEAMGTTEEDYIKVYPMEPRRTAAIGWVRFVWGNEDWVAICDHTTNLEAVLAPTFAWMESKAAA